MDSLEKEQRGERKFEEAMTRLEEIVQRLESGESYFRGEFESFRRGNWLGALLFR